MIFLQTLKAYNNAKTKNFKKIHRHYTKSQLFCFHSQPDKLQLIFLFVHTRRSDNGPVIIKFLSLPMIVFCPVSVEHFVFSACSRYTLRLSKYLKIKARGQLTTLRSSKFHFPSFAYGSPSLSCETMIARANMWRLAQDRPGILQLLQRVRGSIFRLRFL